MATDPYNPPTFACPCCGKSVYSVATITTAAPFHNCRGIISGGSK